MPKRSLENLLFGSAMRAARARMATSHSEINSSLYLSRKYAAMQRLDEYVQLRHRLYQPWAFGLFSDAWYDLMHKHFVMVHKA